jgi:hypothetical protein
VKIRLNEKVAGSKEIQDLRVAVVAATAALVEVVEVAEEA